MVTKHPTACELAAYVCPACRSPLDHSGTSLECRRCRQVYPIVDGLADFVRESLAHSADPMLRRIGTMDRLARFYESRLWYHGVLNLIGGFGSTTLGELVAEISAMVKDVRGRILDAACGPGTYGRRVAGEKAEVFGIDISMNMLREGVSLARRDRIQRMHFARARVEALPFADEYFNAALCCGSLHLFPDTAAALAEIGRTMKPGAILAAMTFTPGGRGLLRFRRLREQLQRRQGLRAFAISDMQAHLAAAGFDDFHPTTYGSILVFRARKTGQV